MENKKNQMVYGLYAYVPGIGYTTIDAGYDLKLLCERMKVEELAYSDEGVMYLIADFPVSGINRDRFHYTYEELLEHVSK